MKVSIIVPCYNEEENIQSLVKRFSAFADDYDIELLVVDNGSKDKTREMILEATEKYSFVRLVIVEQNIGYGNGILQGVKQASGELFGWIHADLQSEPEVFKGMIESAKNEPKDFLYKGARKNRKISDLVFTFGMSILESLYFKFPLWDINSQPTLLSKSFYDSWKNPPIDFSLDLFAYALAKKKKVKVAKFRSVQHKRQNGISSWNHNWFSRINMIKRVLLYSRNVKRIIHEE